MDYFNSKKITGTTMTDTRLKVEQALKTEGFGVLTEIDIQATMKKKLDKDYLPHLILGACNPVFADKVLSVDQHISLMLPCNVSIRELGNEEVEVAIINPLEAMKAIGNPIIEEYAKEVSEKLNRALKNI
ncbi:MAG: DUF302 domain-containing protein [Bacteroidia bacterium]|nr:DUF302 domain-containing protein [Bacteroidia bacterium]